MYSNKDQRGQEKQTNKANNKDEKKNRNRDLPLVSDKQKKGTIFSKLQSRNSHQERNEVAVKTKQSKSGYAMTFSPTNNKKNKNKNRNRRNQENRDMNSTYTDDYRSDNRDLDQSEDYSRHQNSRQDRHNDRQQRNTVRQSEQYQDRPKKQHQGRSMKDMREDNRQRALQKRDTMNNARRDHNSNMDQTSGKRRIPKKLKDVESVIKRRVQIDKEINRKGKQENTNTDKETEIFVPNQKGQSSDDQEESQEQTNFNDTRQDFSQDESKQEFNHDESISKSRSRSGKSRSRSRSRSNSNNKHQRQTSSSGVQQQYSHNNERQHTPNTYQQQKQNHTEGSGYPSVTQASAPPQDYQPRAQNYEHHNPHRTYEEGKYESKQQYQQNYRPSSIGQGADRENNVVDITEGFLNSPMMTQFSDASEPQRQQFQQMQSKEESSGDYK